MDTRPDFERIRKTVRHEEPDSVPLVEVLVDYPIQSQFLGREVKEDDLEAQMAAAHTGLRLIEELVERYGIETVTAYMHHVRDNAARSTQGKKVKNHLFACQRGRAEK